MMVVCKNVYRLILLKKTEAHSGGLDEAKQLNDWLQAHKGSKSA